MKTKRKQKTTRERLLDVAEQMFADHGFRATSLRLITEQAKINNAAVNYHFRSKEDLVKAVLERSFKPVNDARMRALDEAEAAAAGAPLTIEAVLRALFEPTLTAWKSNASFILIAGRLQQEPDPDLHALSLSLYRDLIHRFLAAAKRAMPAVPGEDLFFWIHFLFGAVVHALLSYSDIERLSGGRNILDAPGSFVESLVAFGAAGLRTRFPAPSQPAPESKSKAKRNSRELALSPVGD